MYRFLKEEPPLPVTLEEIELIEKIFQIQFPQILKDFYLQYNAVKMHLCVFSVNGNEYEAAKIIPLKADHAFECIRTNELKDDFIPESFMPLARNRGGDYYYWDSKSEAVYLLYSDCIENPILICDSIEAFFDLLENGSIEA